MTDLLTRIEEEEELVKESLGLETIDSYYRDYYINSWEHSFLTNIFYFNPEKLSDKQIFTRDKVINKIARKIVAKKILDESIESKKVVPAPKPKDGRKR